ncbi:hypothetical protein ASA1KI_22950 [Opitutales bacterium ASA1]|nr:hypothetical protein ASA1KI_22950 [Opitutales bacterium ASA1]
MGAMAVLHAGPILLGRIAGLWGMKTTPQFHAHASQDEAWRPQSERTYSLLEAAQVMGVPLSDLREILKQHELHAESGRRGARVSRREVFNYVSHHPTRMTKAGRGISL